MAKYGVHFEVEATSYHAAQIAAWAAFREQGEHAYEVKGDPVVTELPDLDLNVPEVDVKLACGHKARVHPASSVFDFPDEGDWCPMCAVYRPLAQPFVITNV